MATIIYEHKNYCTDWNASQNSEYIKECVKKIEELDELVPIIIHEEENN